MNIYIGNVIVGQERSTRVRLQKCKSDSSKTYYLGEKTANR